MKTVRIAWGMIFSFAVLIGCGCATNRVILDVRVPQPPNPAMGRKVIISRVTDKRVFEEAPRTPSVPSLKGEVIADKTITSRAIGQKRNSYGKALGDRLLPEGRTVEDLVREALTQSFRDAGYCVLDGAAPSGAVVPIEADIEQFWAWHTPGILAVSLEFEAQVYIKGNVSPFNDGEAVRGHVKLHSLAPNSRAWLNTINKGIEAFATEVRQRLAK